jgi:hypothetical protein
MEIANLRLHLKDEYTNEDTKKEIFLNEIETIFKAHKNSGDTELEIYKGACICKKCDNRRTKGYRFVGNHSKNYIDLIFEIEGDDLKDIFDCTEFETDIEIDDLGTKSDIHFNYDGRITFTRPPDYWAKVYSATSAYSEMITNPPRQINFEELSYWIDKHAVTNEMIGRYNVFKSTLGWSQFSRLYFDLQEIKDYISENINEIKKANSIVSQIKTEQELIDWLLKYEINDNAAPFELKYTFMKNGDSYIQENLNLYMLSGEQFIQTFNFLNFYQENKETLLKKYYSLTVEEEIELENNQYFEKEKIDIYSIRFHLENRKAKKEIGIHIPLYLKPDSGI